VHFHTAGIDEHEGFVSYACKVCLNRGRQSGYLTDDVSTFPFIAFVLTLHNDMTTTIPSYIQVPPSGQVITEPKDLQPPVKPRPPVSARPSFPPAASNTQQPAPRKFNVPTSALSTNVSDLLLSSLLPPNLPKLPASVNKAGDGRVRELSTQREALSLPLVSNNFRRFVTKVGHLFR
jgi:hypothetical protein